MGRNTHGAGSNQRRSGARQRTAGDEAGLDPPAAHPEL
jgi:hypothetical protein